MFKTLLTATLLAILPVPALAITVSLDRSTTPILTYTLRARDTSPSTILSKGGADECTVQLQSRGATLQVAPRPDSAVPHSTAMVNAGAVSASTSGSYTLTTDAGQFSVAFTAADNSSVSITCNPTGGSGATDGVDVLIGGQNGVTDQADPNSPVIVCPRTNAACMYLSSTTGWWSAVSSDGQSNTSWGSQQEEVLLSMMVQGRADMTQKTSYEVDVPAKCARIRVSDYLGNSPSNDWFDCQNYGYTHAPVSSDTIITRVTVTNESAWLTNTGCNLRLATTDGTVLVANSEINLPPVQSTQLAANSSTSIRVGTTLLAGTSFQVQVENGDNCEDGVSCLCDGGAGFFGFEVRGIPK